MLKQIVKQKLKLIECTQLLYRMGLKSMHKLVKFNNLDSAKFYYLDWAKFYYLDSAKFYYLDSAKLQNQSWSYKQRRKRRPSRRIITSLARLSSPLSSSRTSSRNYHIPTLIDSCTSGSALFPCKPGTNIQALSRLGLDSKKKLGMFGIEIQVIKQLQIVKTNSRMSLL